MPSPIWGGLAGAFGGLSQGLQLLMQMKQAEADRKRQGEMDEFVRGEPDREMERIAFRALRDADVTITPQDYRMATSRSTPAMPGMPAISALAQAAGTRGAMPQPAQTLQSAQAAAQSQQTRQAMAGQAPQAVVSDRFGATFGVPEGVRVAAINAANRPPRSEGWRQVSGLPGGSPITEVSDAGITRTLSGPDGKPLLTKPEEMTRKYLNIGGAVESGGIAYKSLPPATKLKAIEDANPGLPGRFFRKLATLQGALPKLRGMVLGDEAVEANLFSSLDKDEQKYWAAGRQFMAGLLKKEIGTQQTIQEFLRQRGTWFPPGELADAGLLKDYQERRHADVQKAISESFGAFSDVYAPLLQQAGYDLTNFDMTALEGADLTGNVQSPPKKPVVAPPRAGDDVNVRRPRYPRRP